MSTPPQAVESSSPDEPSLRDWPHGPAHRLTLPGGYIVTAGTFQKREFFSTPALLTRLTNLLLNLAEARGWMIQAWAVFPNHYHFVAESQRPETLRLLIRELHSRSALQLNREQDAAGRKVWFQYWESRISFHRSYLARLQYVHQNPVHHRFVRNANLYKWCSAGWFERKAPSSFVKVVSSFPIDRVEIPDDFGDLLAP